MTQIARLSATLIFLLTLTTIAVQVALIYPDYGTVWATLWRLGWFFTLLTNAMVCVSFGIMAVRGRSLSAEWLGGLTLWILIVGVVYHTLLAHLYNPEGLRWWTDFGFHTAIPVITALYWLAFAPKRPLPWMAALRWLWWPLVYCLYAMLRGLGTGEYPYPFLDLNDLTLARTAVNVVGLSVGFFLGGLGIIGIARLLAR
jgi:hypothetical protein